MVTVALLSAFINNTAAVAILLPIVLETCRRTGARPGKLLLPLSYASIFGGSTTLIGTSTNIVVHEYAHHQGLTGFSMFELGRLGLPLCLLGILYLLLLGRWLLPHGEADSLAGADEDHLHGADYLVDLYVESDSPWVGRQADPERFQRDHVLKLVGAWRGATPLRRAPPWPKLMPGDRLRVQGSVQQVMALGAAVSAASAGGAPAPVLAEVVLRPGSPAVGHTLETARFRGVYAASILGLRRAHRRAPEGPEILHAGDVLLLRLAPAELEKLKEDPSVLVMAASPAPEPRRGRVALTVLTLVAVVVVAAAGVQPIVTAASAGCLLLMLTGTLHPREAYESINWQVIFMLAGVLALGTAMDKTGIAAAVAQGLGRLSQGLDPRFALSAMYALTVVLSEFMSNSATAALLVPVALDTARILGVNPQPLLVAVAMGASTAFAVPIGYQTHLMVFEPGGYRFADFVRVGLPLDLLFWMFATFAIPLLWPLSG
jgi:di/tricarboxylate transporter